MPLLGVFGLTFLCALVPCDIKVNLPESSIRSEYFTGVKTPWGKRLLQNEYPVVSTTGGKIRGYSMATINGNRLHAFEGIRYAAPPTGNLRFRPPIVPKPWEGVHNAFKPSPKCLQIHPSAGFRVIGDEDCLFLNVYSPNVPESIPLRRVKVTRALVPVVVWIHGGSFIFGAGSEYGPAYITDRNVILVTINYRLGVLGFMSTGDVASPGNYGLKDQVLALKWVHENIQAFGGDPNQLTMMGQSAGAVSVQLHMITNRTRDYFQYGVSLSASAFSHWAIQSKSEALFWTNWLAELVKCPRTTKSGSEFLVECFRRKNGNFLVAYTIRLFRWLIFPPGMAYPLELILFAPVVEVDHPTAFLVDNIENIYNRGLVSKKPWIATLTAEEGYTAIYFLELLQQMKYFRRHFTEFQSFVYDYDHLLNVSEVHNVNQRIEEFYFAGESPETVPASEIAKIHTDRYFTNGQLKALEFHSQIAPTFSYVFDYNGRTNVGAIAGLKKPEWGVGHGEDIFYYLNSSDYYEGMIKSTRDYQLSQVMINLITNFIYKGDPVYTKSLDGEAADILKWEPVNSAQGIRFLYIGAENISMIDNPFVERREFWKSLGIKDSSLSE